MIAGIAMRGDDHDPPSAPSATCPAMPAGAAAPIAYRADIDGLRAVAVVLVLLFHARIGPFGGGYVGVDIFFVISGYLITQLLGRRMAAGDFSILDFYEARIRRLFPALMAMLVVCVAAGAILFLPADFRSFGRNAAGAALFLSNLFLWIQTDYFDGPAELKPLLHTWSLAVEEQFYILFPLFVAWAMRGGQGRLRGGLWLMAGASFALSAWMMPRDASTAFYLTPFRAWELLLGAIVSPGLMPPLRSAPLRGLAGIVGLAMILATALFYSDATPFPGWRALPPCVGAALILHAGRQGASPVVRLLSTRPFVSVGLISYSLYLWHWPLIVFAGYYAIDGMTPAQSLLVVVASFLAGVLSWRYLEQPFRRVRVGRQWTVFAAASVATVAVIGMGAAIFVGDGWPRRFDARVNALSAYALSQNPLADECGDVDLQLRPRSPCTIGDPAKARAMLLGDSHAGAMYGALAAVAKAGGPATVYGATPRCPPLLDIGTDAACIRANRRRLDHALAHPELESVVIAARWSLYYEGRTEGPAETNGNLPELRDAAGHVFPQYAIATRARFALGLTALVDRLLAAGKRVVLVYPVPEVGRDVPFTLARLAAEGRPATRFTISEQPYLRRQDYAIHMLDRLGTHPGLRRIHPEAVLCPGRRCIVALAGEPLYFDSHHLSIPGSRLLAPQFRAALAMPPASRPIAVAGRSPFGPQVYRTTDE